MKPTIQSHLKFLYGPRQAAQTEIELAALAGQCRERLSRQGHARDELLTEKDALLISNVSLGTHVLSAGQDAPALRQARRPAATATMGDEVTRLNYFRFPLSAFCFLKVALHSAFGL